MKSLLSVIIFSAMILLLMYGITWDVDWRTERAKNKRAYNRVLEDRALAQLYASESWSR